MGRKAVQVRDPRVDLHHFAVDLHLAAAFDINPLQLNGPQYIETDFLQQRVWTGGGRVQLPTGPGLGVTVDEARVRRQALEVVL